MRSMGQLEEVWGLVYRETRGATNNKEHVLPDCVSSISISCLAVRKLAPPIGRLSVKTGIQILKTTTSNVMNFGNLSIYK